MIAAVDEAEKYLMNVVAVFPAPTQTIRAPFPLTLEDREVWTMAHTPGIPNRDFLYKFLPNGIT